MIFLEAALSPQNIDERVQSHVEFDDHTILLKKRKLEELGDGDRNRDHEEVVTFLKSSSKVVQNTIELHLETPLPLDWQRCLDIQSGKIYFYNTTTGTRTCMDPRSKLETIEPSSCLGLDLELNLKYSCDQAGQDTCKKPRGRDLTLTRSDTSWLAFDEHHDPDQDDQEMVATVCMNCHMLVMLCKSSPACPNCKFMHPPDQNRLNLFNSRII